MPKLLLTGAAGFTGQHFTSAAQQAGFDVYPLSADLNDTVAMATEVVTVAPDYVVHLAAISAITHADEEAFYRVNLFGTQNLLKALCTLPKVPQRVLLVSSSNVYGNVLSSPIAESTDPAPINHYAISKLAMELMSSTFADRLPLLTARTFNYTGVGQDVRFVIPKLVESFLRRADFVELGNLDVEREFNDVRVVCEAYLRLLQCGQLGQTYNVCSGYPVSLMSVIDTLKQITGHNLRIKTSPEFSRANEVHRLCGDPTKLEACIGLLQHPPLEQTLRWMLSEKV